MEPLTKKQKRVWDYLREVISSRNYPPSVREICQAMGFKSTSTAHAYLGMLEKKGYIRKDFSRPRAIELLVEEDHKPKSFTYKNNETHFVPVVGEVPAGDPVLAEQNIEGYFPLPSGFLSGGEGGFMLKVKGDSMIEAGIKEGDLVIVNQVSEINNGDVVVALMEDEATVKRFYREKEKVRLQPENRNYSPTYHRDLRILGKVVGLFRRM